MFEAEGQLRSFFKRHRVVRRYMSIAIIAFTYFWAGSLCLSLLRLQLQASPVWFPAGIALVAVLWQGPAAGLGIVLGSLWLNHESQAAWLPAAADALGDTVQALLGAYLLQRAGFRHSLERIRDVLGLAGLAGVLAPALAAIVNTLVGYAAGYVSAAQLVQNTWTLWLGDSVGVLVLAPLLLTVRSSLSRGLQQGWQSLYGDRRLEKTIWIGLLLLVSSLVFYCNIQLATTLYPLEYLPFPCVIWAALRFGQLYAALASVALSVIAVSGTAAGRGTFAALPFVSHQAVLPLQAFVGVVTLTALIVAAITQQQQQAEERIRLTAERNRLLSEMSLSIRQSLDLQQILETTVAEVRYFLRADRVFFTRVDSENYGKVVAESVAPGWKSMLGWQVNDPLVYQEIQALFAQDPIKVINDTSAEVRSPFIMQYHDRYQVRATIGVPILESDAGQQLGWQAEPQAGTQAGPQNKRLFGALVVNQCAAPRQWQPLEIELMQQLGIQVAIAIQQAQLYQQVQTLNTTLERQVEERTLQLQANMAALEELNQFRDVLIHAIAHDLRTTVMGSLMVLENLQKQPGKQISIDRSLLTRMQDSGEVQLNKLNSLLKAYTFATEGVPLDRQEIALAPLLQSVLAKLHPAFEQNYIRIDNQLSSATPRVWGDAQQIQDVFWQLLSNVVKHNPPGTQVSIHTEYQGEQLKCIVQDNGKGIVANQCDRLFDLRLGEMDDRQRLGISLGLHLCQQIVAAQGGEIGVKSELEVGSQFWFTLPLASAHSVDKIT